MSARRMASMAAIGMAAACGVDRGGLAPPLALACLAGAMQDGGDSACEALLSSLVDAGVCH